MARDGRNSADLPRMDWYPRDFQSDARVRVMTLEQQGAYRALLDFSWMDGPLPNDHAYLAKLLGISRRAFTARVWPRVAPCFTEEGSTLVNPRLERERQRAINARKRASTKGRLGAEKRWRGHSTGNAPAISQAMPGDSPSSVIRQPSKEDPPKAPQGGPAGNGEVGPTWDQLVEVWNANRGGLRECRKTNDSLRRQIEKALIDEPDLETWAKAVRLKAEDEHWLLNRYGIQTLIRPSKRSGYLDAGEQFRPGEIGKPPPPKMGEPGWVPTSPDEVDEATRKGISW